MRSIITAAFIAFFTSAAKVADKLGELSAKQGIPDYGAFKIPIEDETPANMDLYWGDTCETNTCGCANFDDCHLVVMSL